MPCLMEKHYKYTYLNKWTQHASLKELQCTSRHRRECESVRVAPDQQTYLMLWHLCIGSARLVTILLPSALDQSNISCTVATDQQAGPILRYHANKHGLYWGTTPTDIADNEVPHQQAWSIVRHHTRRHDLQRGIKPEGITYNETQHQQTSLIMRYHISRHGL